MLRMSRPIVSNPLSILTLAVGLAFVPAIQAQSTTAPADNTPLGTESVAPVPAPAPAAASPQDRLLRNDVDAYFHYAWIGRYDLAAQFAQKVTDEAADPAALIPVLEATAKLHDPSMGYLSQLLFFDNQADLKDSTDKLLLKVQAGNVARSQDPGIIEQTIRDMAASERGYENHLPILRHSGELAVPVMIQFLRLEDEQHMPYRGTVRRALVDIGKSAVNPLLAATESSEKNTLLAVIDALGSLGYDVAAPYLARLAHDSSSSDEVKTAANTALAKLQITPQMAADPARLYFELSLKFYYDKADMGQTVNNPGSTPSTPILTRNFWNWDAEKGLVRTEVPAGIFNDLMSMRTTESALNIKSDMPEAVGLWLDADNKREADLAAGESDPIHGDQPPAHYFNVSSGARHLDDALSRSLADRNAAVTLKLSHSLGLIVGRSSLDTSGQPLSDALRFPEKRVRYEAACALASALPDKPFANQEMVVPLLVQAIGEGGGGNLIVLAASRDDANALQESLRKLGYVTAAAASPGEAVSAASSLPSVDAIVIARGAGDDEVARMISLAAQTHDLAGLPQIILREQNTGYAAAQALGNPLVTVSTQSDGEALKKDVESARAKAGVSPLTQTEADAYSLRAAKELENLAVNGNAVLNVAVGEAGLLAALDGPRTELVAAVGDVLARINSDAAQRGLARRALNDQSPPAVRIAIFRSLTISAKAFGNRLEPTQVTVLQREAVELKENEIRSAAAEARGALNLPTDEARNLILDQGK